MYLFMGMGLGRCVPTPMGRGLWKGCAPPQKISVFFASEWCILRLFWHMIRQFTTPVLMRLKSAKSSDIVTKPCKVVIRLCFSGTGLSVCKLRKFVRLTRKVMNGFWWNFLEHWRSDYILGPIAPIIYRRVNNVKNGGLEDVCTLWVPLMFLL